MTTKAVLSEARNLIATPGQWAQGCIGTTRDGDVIDTPAMLDRLQASELGSLCSAAAIRKAGDYQRSTDRALRVWVRAVLNLPRNAPVRKYPEFADAIDWQNAETTTHEQVLAALDRALGL